MTQITVYLNNETSVQRTLEYWEIDSRDTLRVVTKTGMLYVFPLASITYFTIKENDD